jgi:hypothetical protein
MRDLVKKVLLFAMPFLVIMLVELFVLPLNQFTFRPWEALISDGFGKSGMIPVTGPFYANQRMEMLEQGAEGRRSHFARRHRTVFETDEYGFRRAPSPFSEIDVLILGDSNTVGSGLDQHETLSHQLEEKLGTGVYPYAPSSVEEFYLDGRFRSSPPKIVLLTTIERYISLFEFRPKEWDESARRPGNRIRAQIRTRAMSSACLQGLLVLQDRVKKQVFYNLVVTRIRHGATHFMRDAVGLDENPEFPVAEDHSMIFFQGAAALAPQGQMAPTLKQMTQFQEYLEGRGIQLVFMPIPNRETIHFDVVPGYDGGEPTFLQEFILQTREAGIPTIDLLSQYRAARSEGIPLYLVDDSHWNSIAVELAVKEVLPSLRRALDGEGRRGAEPEGS